MATKTARVKFDKKLADASCIMDGGGCMSQTTFVPVRTFRTRTHTYTCVCNPHVHVRSYGLLSTDP